MGDLRKGQFSKPKSADQSHTESQAKVLDFGAFKTRKALSADRTTSVSEAFSGMTLRTQSNNQVNGQPEVELSERIERIKSSIQRINQLMAELKGNAPGTLSNPK